MDKDFIEINEEDTFVDKGGENGVAMRWNVLPASDRPNDMGVNWNSPRRVQNAVLWASYIARF